MIDASGNAIADLGAAFEKAYADYLAVRDAHFAAPDDEALVDRVEDALARAHAATEAIMQRPARTPADLRVKALALAWEFEGEPDDQPLPEIVSTAAIRGLIADVAGPARGPATALA